MRDFFVWDYTFSVIRQPERFASGEIVPGGVSSVPTVALKALTPLVPTYIWSPRSPTGDRRASCFTRRLALFASRRPREALRRAGSPP